MDIRALLKQGSSLEELEQSLLDLDSEFDFKCRHCGKCCKNQDTVLFTARDIYNIAKKLGKTTEHVIQECGEVSIGYSSRIPLVHMVPIGPQRRCPLLRDDGRCSVHDCKPTACALFPVGRVASIEGVLDKNMEVTKDCVKVRYVLNDFNCGSAKRHNTIRSWLARFQIPEEDDFFLEWTVVTANLSVMVNKMENLHFPSRTLEMVWNIIFSLLYVNYDTGKEFMPQFASAAEQLNALCRKFWSLEAEETEDSSVDKPKIPDLLKMETSDLIWRMTAKPRPQIIGVKSFEKMQEVALWRSKMTVSIWKKSICNLYPMIRHCRKVADTPVISISTLMCQNFLH